VFALYLRFGVFALLLVGFALAVVLLVGALVGCSMCFLCCLFVSLFLRVCVFVVLVVREFTCSSVDCGTLRYIFLPSWLFVVCFLCCWLLDDVLTVSFVCPLWFS